MFGKLLRVGFYVFMALVGGVLLLAFFNSDKLTVQQAAQRIVQADEPCREAYTRALDLRGAGSAKAKEAVEVSRAGEVTCRKSFENLDRIAIFIPKGYGADEARDKKRAIDYCAAYSRVRADLLGQFAATAPDQARTSALEAELAESEDNCRKTYGRLVPATP